ncbi:MAG: carbohydrate kinase family protein [Bryobacteraceae bacterium]
MIVCAGNFLVDILTRPVEEIRWNATVWVEHLEQSLGGNGANTSFAIAKLGGHVRTLGTVGVDPFASHVLDALGGVGADTSRIERTTAAPTSATTVLVRSDGARALLHRPGASRLAFPEPIEFTPELTRGAAHFHLANPFGLPLLRPHAGETLGRARAAGLTTSLDTGWDSRGEWMRVISPCLPHLDLLFVNEDEARMLTGSSEPEAAATALRAGGARVVIVKLGADGCLVVDETSATSVPAFPVNVVDSTGAGDCFVGAFLVRRLEGAPLAECARFANAVGALVVGALGSTTGLLDRAATEAWIEAHAAAG